MKRFPGTAYIAPFAVFLAAMYVHSFAPIPELADQIVRIAAPALAIVVFSRGELDFRLAAPWASVAIGIAVFVCWIAPDLLVPSWRHLRIFENPLLGYAQSSLSAPARANPAILVLRTARAAVVVPIVEELFWRAWLMRWLISPRFEKVPLGTYQAAAFWICALLFASEHGPFWDVGLLAGIAYNWWMVRTRSLGDLILAHAVTNACLSFYSIAAGRWEYWL